MSDVNTQATAEGEMVLQAAELLKDALAGVEGGVAECVALVNPAVGHALVALLQELADGDDEGEVNPLAVRLARAVLAQRT